MTDPVALARDLRANPRYELVPVDRLAPAERSGLARLGSPADLYGILQPRPGESLGRTSVDCDTALLFLTLREPGPLPAFARARLGESAPRTVAELVAAHILEVAAEGGFCSGASGLAILRGGSDGETAAASGRLAALSAAALRYAARLAVDDPGLLTLRLYGYNHRPLTAAWARRLPDTAAVRSYLGLQPGGANRRQLDRAWREREPFPGWLSWHARGVVERPIDAAGATYKLYLSPQPEALADGFGALLAELTAARVPGFKVGHDAWGLLRPDKIVAHLRSFEELAEVASRLTARLAGLPVQGVPFTAEIGGGGLLSWGVDPPLGSASGTGAESWRFWLARRLARAILDARAVGDAQPWRSAAERLRLAGVDTDTWTPGADLWREG